MENELTQQATELINWSQRKLASQLPEFLPAIYLLPIKASEQERRLWTDGQTLYFHPATAVRDYLERKDSIAAQLMHIIAHGLLGHIPKRQGQQPQLFDAVADIKAAAFADRLPINLPRTADRETVRHMWEWDKLTLEAAYLAPESREAALELIRKSKPLEMDDHGAWLPPDSGKGGGQGSGIADRWESAARQVAEALAKSGRGQLFGTMAGEMCEDYGDAEESGVSYKEFLRMFCSSRERQEVDPDSISRPWYHLGLQLTGNAPFVEPEELREDAHDLDLAVALDTSGSCCGDIMKGFLGELLAILRDAGGPRVRMTLIQCDAEIQRVQTLSKEEDADSLARDFSVYGCGGTDFRPVFDYIEQQRQDPEGRPFRGLLYLSDGCGTFPDRAPDYPVAFLFPKEEDEWDGPWGNDWLDIPDWVTKVHITDDNRLLLTEADTNS